MAPGEKEKESSVISTMTNSWLFRSTVVAALAWAVLSVLAGNAIRADDPSALSTQVVFVDPKSFAVIGANGRFRTNSFDGGFNPTNTSVPFFQSFDESFSNILGSSPSINEIANNSTYAFAHEAPVYDSKTGIIFFGSNDGGALGNSDNNTNNKIWSLNVNDAVTALKSSPTVNVPIKEIPFPDTVQMTNGGTGPFRSSLLLATSGRGNRPPSIVLANQNSPYNTTVLLDNYFGRQFNSLNDVKVHPSGKIFFTDVTYGSINRFRPSPLMPNQVYRLDPDTAQVRVVADRFNKCNGIAFTSDGKTAYITDTGAAGSSLDPTAAATIYAFDVDLTTHAFGNRRVFAYADAGIPDGVQVDSSGNVYSGCGDGVQVWNSQGTLLGKFFLGRTSANMAFAGDGRLVILAETKVFLAQIAAKGISLGGGS